MLNTQTVVSILAGAGLVAHKRDRDYTRPGFEVRKLTRSLCGVLFDSCGNDGRRVSFLAQEALSRAGLYTKLMEDCQTLQVSRMRLK